MHLNVFSVGTGPDNSYWVNYEWMNDTLMWLWSERNFLFSMLNLFFQTSNFNISIFLKSYEKIIELIFQIP